MFSLKFLHDPYKVRWLIRCDRFRPLSIGFRHSIHGAELLGKPVRPQWLQRVGELAIRPVEALGGMGAMELRPPDRARG